MAPVERLSDDAFVAPQPELARFALAFEREGGAVTAVAHGSSWFAREGTTPPEPPEPDPAWWQLVGHYRGFGLWPMNVRVLVRRGRLRLYDAIEQSDDELVPLGDGRFRVGVETWRPSRIRFDTVIDGRATRAWLDGAAFYRTFTP